MINLYVNVSQPAEIRNLKKEKKQAQKFFGEVPSRVTRLGAYVLCDWFLWVVFVKIKK
jgi:hypothetical protein